MKVEAIDTIVRFKELKEQWRNLEQRVATTTPYQTWDWLNTWLLQQQQMGCLNMLAVFDARGRLVGVAPFRRESALVPGFYILVFVGQEVSISPDLMLAPGMEEAIIKSILRFIGGQRQVFGVVMKSVQYESSSSAVLHDSLESSKIPWEREVYSETASLRLPTSYDEFLAGLSSKMRQEMRAARRKMETCRELEFTVVDTAENCGNCIEELLALNDMRWGKSGGRAVCEAVYPSLMQKGMLRIFILRVDGQPAAAVSALASGAALFAEVAGFDYEVDSRNLGKYFYGRLIEWAIENGFDVLDLSSGDESYKRRLKPEIYPKVRIIFAASSFRFKLVQFVRYMGQRIRWLRKVSLL